jgi:hypothetical protein
MLALLLNHSPAFLTGEFFLGLCLGMFGFALVGTAREKYSVRVPAAEVNAEVKEPTVP